MAGVVQYITDTYKYYIDELPHPQGRHYFLAGHPIKIILILASYNYFCLKLGPALMKNRKPFNLRNVIIIYNICQILVNIYIFYQTVVYVYAKEFDFRCAGVDDPASERAAQIVPAVHLYYINKLTDLLETIFFVLRKSNRQITRLHMHHHTLMPFAAYVATTYYPGGQSIIIGHLNCFVHTVMYVYYLLAGLGDNYKHLVWWKKYLTMLQLLQFVVGGTQATVAMFHECNFPYIYRVITALYGAIFFDMFIKFYKVTYVEKKDKPPGNNQNGTHRAEKIKEL